jgi:hypothetical protein
MCFVEFVCKKKHSLENKIKFITYYDFIIGDNKKPKEDLFLDYCHLNSSLIYTEILNNTKKII